MLHRFIVQQHFTVFPSSPFAKCKVNSSYCDCKVIKHTKIVTPLYFSTLYPYFIHPLHTIAKRNIAYTKNYTTKCKKCFPILKKHFHLWQGYAQHIYCKVNFKQYFKR